MGMDKNLNEVMMGRRNSSIQNLYMKLKDLEMHVVHIVNFAFLRADKGFSIFYRGLGPDLVMVIIVYRTIYLLM